MRLGTKCLVWSFLAIGTVFMGLQFVALHKLANSGDGQNHNNWKDLPYHLSQPSVPDASASRLIPPNTEEQDPKSSSFRKTEQARFAAAPQPQPPQRHHIIFSTSCHYTQDWQSYLFFYQAMKVNQPGDVTRIVSGCNSEQQQELQELFDSLIGSMSDRFHIHFTPGMCG
jgi:hypothetical protein